MSLQMTHCSATTRPPLRSICVQQWMGPTVHTCECLADHVDCTSIARRLHVDWPIHHTARRLPTLTHPCYLPVIKVLPVRTRRVRENAHPDRAAQARQLRHQLLLFLTVLKMLLCHIHHTPRPGDPSALLSPMLIRCLSVHLQSDAIRCCDQPPAAIQARLR